MLYFKKTHISSDLEKEEMEKGLRSKSLKRSQSLDFIFETINIGTDKYFLGNEGKNHLKFTRIKTLFESFLPKIIVSLPKATALQYYRFRLSFLSTVIFAMLSFLVITFFWSLITNQHNNEAFLIAVILLVIYSLLILLELKITKGKILKSTNHTII